MAYWGKRGSYLQLSRPPSAKRNEFLADTFSSGLAEPFIYAHANCAISAKLLFND
jgi:hypothetical protein